MTQHNHLCYCFYDVNMTKDDKNKYGMHLHTIIHKIQNKIINHFFFLNYTLIFRLIFNQFKHKHYCNAKIKKVK